MCIRTLAVALRCADVYFELQLRALRSVSRGALLYLELCLELCLEEVELFAIGLAPLELEEEDDDQFQFQLQLHEERVGGMYRAEDGYST